MLTIDIELIQLGTNVSCWGLESEEASFDEVHDARRTRIEIDRKMLCVHLASLAISFVEDILIIHAKRRLGARFCEGGDFLRGRLGERDAPRS